MMDPGLSEKVKSILQSMDYGTNVESENVLKTWLSRTFQNWIIGCFVDNVYPNFKDYPSVELTNPSVGVKLLLLYDSEELMKPKKEGTSFEELERQKLLMSEQKKSSWFSTSSHQRAKLFYSLAQNIRKQQLLISLVESATTGRHISSAKDIDTPNLIACVTESAGIAQLCEEASNNEVIGIIATEAPSPVFSLCWKFIPLLARGKALTFLVSSECFLSTLLFAELCRTSGFPKGAVNVLVCPQKHPLDFFPEGSNLFSKVFYQGSKSIGQTVTCTLSRFGIPVEISPNLRTTAIIFESADQKSAVDSVLFTSHSAIGTCHGCRLLVQESIYVSFVNELKARFALLKVGTCNSKTADLSVCITDEENVDQLLSAVKSAESEGACVLTTETVSPVYLILDVQPTSRIVLEQTKGVVIVVLPFRTIKESIALANSKPGCHQVSIWSERLTVALEAAQGVKASTIWINGQNNYSESTYEVNVPLWKGDPLQKGFEKSFGVLTEKEDQKSFWSTVETVSLAQKIWERKTGHQKAEAFLAFAEYLENGKEEFFNLSHNLDIPQQIERVNESISILYTAAALCSKTSGDILDSCPSALSISVEEPLGVVVVDLESDALNLFKLISLLAAVLVTGNAVILISSNPDPLLRRLIFGSQFPAGLPILVGNAHQMIRNLCLYGGADVFWFYYSGSSPAKGFCLHSGKKYYLFGEDISFEDLIQRSKKTKRMYTAIGDSFAN